LITATRPTNVDSAGWVGITGQKDSLRYMNSDEISHHIARLKESFLCAAARGGRTAECASLLDLGAELEWHEPSDDTPLIAAVRNGHQETSALLLAYGANAATRDANGNTIMHIISSRGDESMASLFSPNASALALCTNNDGMTGTPSVYQSTIF